MFYYLVLSYLFVFILHFISYSAIITIFRPDQFSSLAVLDPTAGHTMNVLSPFISVLCHSD